MFTALKHHEVDHWLGLRHIWGDGDCLVDDFFADTPNAAGLNFECTANFSCATDDVIENYMDYTEDGGMNIFSLDQKDRMLTVLQNSPRLQQNLLIIGGKRVKESAYAKAMAGGGDQLRTTRKPILPAAIPGRSQPRYVTLTLLVVLDHDPPRSTRLG